MFRNFARRSQTTTGMLSRYFSSTGNTGRGNLIIGIFGLVVALGGLQLEIYKIAREMKEIQDTKKEGRLTYASMKLQKDIDGTCSKFIDDLLYKPFLLNSAMEIAIREEIIQETRQPGAVIVLAPKDAGKSTRMHKVLRELKEKNQIAGGYSVYRTKQILESDSPLQELANSIDAPDVPFTDVLPITQVPVILVFDRVDELFEEQIDSPLLNKLKELIRALAMASVTPQGRNFQVFVLTSNPKIAKTMLTINGGKKVRLLAKGEQINGGSDCHYPTNWQTRGLKLKEKDIEDLVDKFDDDFKLHLQDNVKKKLIDIGAISGTVGFIRDLCIELEKRPAENRLAYLESQKDNAKIYQKEWEECAQVGMSI